MNLHQIEKSPCNFQYWRRYLFFEVFYMCNGLNAGTGNGMAKSLLDTVGQPCTALCAVLAIIRGYKWSCYFLIDIMDILWWIFVIIFINYFFLVLLSTGHKRSLDVATILQGETRFYSVLMLAWGKKHIIFYALLLNFSYGVVSALYQATTFFWWFFSDDFIPL